MSSCCICECEKKRERERERGKGESEVERRVFFLLLLFFPSTLSFSALDSPMCSGIGTSLLPRHLSSVDLPQPLGPMRPYRLFFLEERKREEVFFFGKGRVSRGRETRGRERNNKNTNSLFLFYLTVRSSTRAWRPRGARARGRAA